MNDSPQHPDRAQNPASILPVTYRMQGVNMACLPACIAMLLSVRGETAETWDVIEKFRMPYRIRAIPSEDRVVAATGFEFDAWSRLYCMREYGCELITERIDADRVASRLDELLRSSIPIVLSVQRSSGGHAVVAHGLGSSGVGVFDPENTVRLRRPEKVRYDARPPVERIAVSDLVRQLRHGADGRCALGWLADVPRYDESLPEIRDWLNGRCSSDGNAEGIKALEWVLSRIETLRVSVRGEMDTAHARDLFYEVGTNCLAPLVRNLLGAIVASGIVHLNDGERVGICCGILEALEHLFERFMDGLNRLSQGDVIGEETWTGMSHALERLLVGFSRIDPE